MRSASRRPWSTGTGTGWITPSCPGRKAGASCWARSATGTRTRTAGRPRPARGRSAPTWSRITWTRSTNGPRRPAPRSSPRRTTPTTGRTTSPPPTRRGTAGRSAPTGASRARGRNARGLTSGYHGGVTQGSRSSVPGTRAWHVAAPGPVTGRPLRLNPDDETPRPGPGELLLKVLACGVCRTDLHVTEGDLEPRKAGVTPGHEVVGEVTALGEGAEAGGVAVGDRAGPRGHRPRAHPRRAGQAARPGAGRGERRRRGGHAARAAGRRDPVRPGRRPGAARHASPGPGRHAVHRGHPPVRHPAAELREA